MTTLLDRLVRRRPRASHLSFTVYSREDCDCCRRAMEVIEPQRRRHRFTVEVVDVDADPELAARHGDWVPVVAVDGRVRFKGKVNPVLLERLLAAESRGG